MVLLQHEIARCYQWPKEIVKLILMFFPPRHKTINDIKETHSLRTHWMVVGAGRIPHQWNQVKTVILDQFLQNQFPDKSMNQIAKEGKLTIVYQTEMNTSLITDVSRGYRPYPITLLVLPT